MLTLYFHIAEHAILHRYLIIYTVSFPFKAYCKQYMVLNIISGNLPRHFRETCRRSIANKCMLMYIVCLQFDGHIMLYTYLAIYEVLVLSANS